MKFTDNFSNCDLGGCYDVFRQSKVPVFQNKVYRSAAEARAAAMGDVFLVQSKQSGFVFNKEFDPAIMVYDENYHNEQSNSGVFLNHLHEVLDLLRSVGINDKKVVEVGSGKGVFFEMLLQGGIDCFGFDPAYEGNNPRITKEYFSSRYDDINADIIIMRHTLEHIPNPFSFIHTIAKANNYRGQLFVEVPTFDWIENKEAFWDIFYEHCNYFTEKSLASMFKKARTGSLFGGQYIYLWADLKDLQDEIPLQTDIRRFEPLVFEKKLNYYLEFMKNHQPLAIWGAGAKGSTFLNLLDPRCEFVKFVIDINPPKQNKHIAGTGHKIYSPEIMDSFSEGNILVMNENYLEEIRATINNDKIKLHHL
jgi:2-polyprenyl-3-methyl-5-hydroxy-6-metoxy-1,4-benzoquinol methylase